MEASRAILEDLALVLCVAAVTTVLFRGLRQPVVLGYLLAGMIVGPHLPVPIFVDEGVLEEAGVLFEADEEEQEVEQFREFLDNISPEDFAQ